MSGENEKRLETQFRTIFGDEYINDGKFNFPQLIDEDYSISTVISAICVKEVESLKRIGFKESHACKLIRLFKVTSEKLQAWDVLDEEEKKEIADLYNLTDHMEEPVSKNKEYLEKAFHAKFEGEQGMSGQIRNRLDQYMSQCAYQWEKGNTLRVYGPICLISQSSGYGKSRMLYEVASNRILTYICLRREGDKGYPKRTQTAPYFESTYLTGEYKAKCIIYFLIQNALNDVKSILARHGKKALDSPDITRQIATAYREKQPWQIKPNRTSVQIIEREYSEDEIRHLQQEFKATMRDEPLLIVIDEAHELFINSQNVLSYLRAVIYKHFVGFRIAVVLVSTNCSIANYQQSPHQKFKTDSYVPFSWFIHTDSSSRVNEYTNELKKIYNSLVLTGNKQSASRAKRMKTNLYEWLKQLCPESTFFLFGRPLWTAYYNTERFNMKIMSKIKLLHPSSYIDGHLMREAFSHYISNTLSVLGIRTDFFIHRINPSYVTACELIDKCMATLVDVENKIGQITLRYVSEPILANAAADYMCVMPYLHDMLECFLQYLDRSSNKLSLVELGELTAELILLIAKDKAAVEKYPDDLLQHARPITLDGFLTALLGTNYTEIMRLGIPTHLREALVSFSHFTKKIDELSIEDVVCDFIGRNAAGLFMDNCPGHDLFIPLVLNQDPWIGLVLIQAKNDINFLGPDELKKIHQIADPCKVGKALNYPLDETNTVCLIMDLVNPSSKLNQEVDDKSFQTNDGSADMIKPTVEKLTDPDYKHVSYLVRGCGSNAYPCLDETISEFINELVNLPRFPDRKYSRFVQKAGFNGARSIKSRKAVSIDAVLDPNTLTELKLNKV